MGQVIQVDFRVAAGAAKIRRRKAASQQFLASSLWPEGERRTVMWRGEVCRWCLLGMSHANGNLVFLSSNGRNVACDATTAKVALEDGQRWHASAPPATIKQIFGRVSDPDPKTPPPPPSAA